MFLIDKQFGAFLVATPVVLPQALCQEDSVAATDRASEPQGIA